MRDMKVRCLLALTGCASSDRLLQVPRRSPTNSASDGRQTNTACESTGTAVQQQQQCSIKS